MMTGKTASSQEYVKSRRAFSKALMDGTALARISAVALVLGGALVGPAWADDSTWLELAIDNDYNNVVNWSPNAVPDNQGDTAIFGTTNTPLVIVGAAGADVDEWVFIEGSQDYTFINNGNILFFGDGLVVNGVGVEIDNNDSMVFYSTSSVDGARINNHQSLSFVGSSTAATSLIFNSVGGSVSFASSSSAGNATIENNGTLAFTNSASAANAIMVNPGTLTFGSVSTAGRANIINGGFVTFNNAANAGSASIINAPAGTVEFFDDTTAGTAGILNHGNLEFSDNSSAGSATIENHDDVYFFGTSSAGNATFDNHLIQYFFDNSTAGSATFVNGHTLGFDNNSTAANAVITNNGAVGLLGNGSAGNATIFNNNLVQVAANASLGNARVINGAAATVDISGLVAASTTVGSIEGAGDINLGDRGLIVGQNDLSTEFSGVLFGVGGSLQKVGEGALTLSGVNTYTGPTSISGGTLIVNGSIANAFFVDVFNGGTLGGTGTVSNTFAWNGSTVAPGNSIGTLNVAGNITFGPGSSYEVEINSAGQSDLIDATGAAALNGGSTVEVVPFPDFALDTQYTILSAAGGVNVIGGGMGVDFADGSIFLTPSLTYGANDVFLNIAQTAGFESAALTPNQIAAAGGAQSLGGGPLFTAIALLGTQDEARAAFDAISGEIHASAKTALIEDSRHLREAANDRVRAAFAAAQDDGAGVWVRGFGALGHTASDGNAAALGRSAGGLFAGADGEVSDNWLFGALAGYSHSNFNVGDRASSGSANSYHLGAYGGGGWQNWALRFGGGYSWHNIAVSRTAAFPGFTDSLSSGYSAGTAQLFGELGYKMKMHGADIEPFANAAWVNHTASGPVEAGGAAALTGTADTLNTTFTTLGLRASKEFVTGKGTKLQLTGMAGWRHAFGAGVPTATLAFAGGSPFTIAGVPIARDALVLDLGADIALGSSTALGLAYSGQIASSASSHSVKASVGARF